jgi:hypothetical protein
MAFKHTSYMTVDLGESRTNPHLHISYEGQTADKTFGIYLDRLSSLMMMAASLTASMSLSAAPVGQFRLMRVLRGPVISICPNLRKYKGPENSLVIMDSVSDPQRAWI